MRQCRAGAAWTNILVLGTRSIAAKSRVSFRSRNSFRSSVDVRQIDLVVLLVLGVIRLGRHFVGVIVRAVYWICWPGTRMSKRDRAKTWEDGNDIREN